MESAPLISRLQIPRLPKHLIFRQHLINFIESEILGHKLILLAAPAGYGKTTLLAQWVRKTHNDIVWIRASQYDKDWLDLLRYMYLGWEKINPDLHNSPMEILINSLTPQRTNLQTAFINTVVGLDYDIIFLFDDYHLITEKSMLDTLAFLIDNAPKNLHFILAGRIESPLPFARYRAREELIEIRAIDLRFTPEEAVWLIKDQLKIDIPNNEMDSLISNLEGWIAGLKLFALVMQQQNKRGEDLTFKSKNRFIEDYFRIDIFNHLSPEIKMFVLSISILDSFCAQLCCALTGINNSQEMLRSLIKEDLFIISLDENYRWFKFHPVFSMFLNDELKLEHPKKTQDLHKKAALWYLHQDYPEQAFYHSVLSNSPEIVSKLLENYLFSKLQGGEINVIKRWLADIPRSWQGKYPMIVFAQAGIFLATGQFEDCLMMLDQIEKLSPIGNQKSIRLKGRVAAMRCNVACFENNLEKAISLADMALSNLPENDLDFRAGVYGALGDTFRRNGHWQKAKESYQKLLKYSNAPSFRIQLVNVYGALADLELRQGYLKKAAYFWGEALSAIKKRENWGYFPLPLIGWVYIRMAELNYEWNDINEAWKQLDQGITRVELGEDILGMIAGYLLTAKLKLFERDFDEAQEFLNKSKTLISMSNFSHLKNRFDRIQAELWLTQGKLDVAQDWLESVKIISSDETTTEEQHHLKITVTRILIEIGDSISNSRAQRILEDLILTAEKEGRYSIKIEALALKSILFWKRGEQATAIISLESALTIAQPEGYLHIFTDLGLTMGRLLLEAYTRKIKTGYIKQLIEVYNGIIDLSESITKKLIEPLTSREVDVVKLLAVGLTNIEIAEQLFISPGTVKKHTSNIYQKFGAHNRTEATARARELNLLN